jgi:hypothetical protein
LMNEDDPANRAPLQITVASELPIRE